MPIKIDKTKILSTLVFYSTNEDVKFNISRVPVQTFRSHGQEGNHGKEPEYHPSASWNKG